jgi:urea transport system substrate-binding protein
MTTDSRITDLLSRWDSLREQGQTLSVEELCGQHPELADELRKHLELADRPSGSVNETLNEPATAESDPSSEVAKASPRTKTNYPNVPGYEFVGELGRGGMGVVYKARQTNLNRLVAIKTILAGEQAGTRDRARFYAEAEAVARLGHANIVQIYDIGECDGAPYFSMEFVDGPSLHRRLESKPVDATTAALLIETVALAIDYAHQRGIVHRDLKPANILMAGPADASLQDCTPKLTDFGLARQLQEDVRLTQTGVVLGTPCYMAPEQVEDPTADIHPTVDVYGLGALLYELLTGRPPFSAPTNFETMRQVVTDAPTKPSLLQPSVPRALEQICMKCLEKRPKDRYPSAQALADDLATFLEGEHPSAALERPSGMRRWRGRRPISSRGGRGQSRAERNWQLTMIGLLSLVVIMMGIAGLVHHRNKHHESADGAGATALPVIPLAPIRVGVLHSLTGTMAISESAVVDATLLAIDELNEQGGLLGRKIEAIVRDGRSDSATFAAEAKKLIKDEGVCTVFGCWTSASRKTVLPIFETNDNLLVYPVEFEGLEESTNVVYIGAVPNQQIIPAVKWCFAFLDRRRFFLIGSDYVFPRAANEIVKDELKKLKSSGVEVVGEAYIPMGETDCADVIRQIKEARPDVILNSINGDSNIAFFRALRTAGIKPGVVPVVSFSIGEQELRSMKIEDVVGDYVARNYFQSTDRPENQKFLERFWARYGQQRVVGDAMESAYLGVHLWAQAVAKAGTDDAMKIRDGFRGQEYLGPGGRVYVDPVLLNTHRISRIGRIRSDGQFDAISGSESPVAPEIFPKTRTREQWEAFLESLYDKWDHSWSGPTE